VGADFDGNRRHASSAHPPGQAVGVIVISLIAAFALYIVLVIVTYHCVCRSDDGGKTLTILMPNTSAQHGDVPQELQSGWNWGAASFRYGQLPTMSPGIFYFFS